MRCNNCGWDNDPGASNCVKCGHPLSGGGAAAGNPYQGVNVPDYSQDGGARAPRPTVIGAGASLKATVMDRGEAPLKATVMDRGGAAPLKATVLDRGGAAPLKATVLDRGGAAPLKATVMDSGMQAEKPRTPRPTVRLDVGSMPDNNMGEAPFNPMPENNFGPTPDNFMSGDPSHPVCPECGYVLNGDFGSCPNCGATIPKSGYKQPTEDKQPNPKRTFKETVVCPNCQSEISSKFMFCPMCGKPIPHEEPKNGPRCSLTIIPDEDENCVEQTNNYEGEQIVLNRDNTEPSNRTITSKEQAVLISEEGKWYIENRSEQCSTYLEANRRLEVLPGDIIMLGDRRFKFNVEQNQ